MTIHQIIQVLSKAAFRLDSLFILGGYSTHEENYEARIVGPDKVCLVGSGYNPQNAIFDLFNSALQSGLLTQDDFEGYKRLVVYRAYNEKTNLTIKCLRLLVSTEYLRVAFPENGVGYIREPEFLPEFVISYRGSSNSANYVVKRVKETLSA